MIITLYVNLDGIAADVVSRLNDCATSIARWLMFNDLQLNPSKSEAIKVGTRHQVKSSVGGGLSIVGATVSPSSHIKLLGVTFDSTLSFDQHITDVCNIANFHLKSTTAYKKPT
jgi:hypothetical protein